MCATRMVCGGFRDQGGPFNLEDAEGGQMGVDTTRGSSSRRAGAPDDESRDYGTISAYLPRLLGGPVVISARDLA